MTNEKRAAFRSVVRANGNGYCASGCSGISIKKEANQAFRIRAAEQSQSEE